MVVYGVRKSHNVCVVQALGAGSDKRIQAGEVNHFISYASKGTFFSLGLPLADEFPSVHSASP